MYTVLITGGAGFIGSNLIRYFRHHHPDYRLIALDAFTRAGSIDNLKDIPESEYYSFWYGNTRNGELVDMLVEQSDFVIHLAAETYVTRSIFDNRLFFETDIIGTQAVANAVVRHNKTVKRFIHVSTSEVYGASTEPSINEDHAINPVSPYASSKAGADRLVYSYWATYDIPAVILRPFNQFGPYQPLDKAVPRFIINSMRDEPLTIHGDGSAERDWTYVEDFCSAIDRCLHIDFETIRGQVINIGTGKSISILDIARLILKMTKKDHGSLDYIPNRKDQLSHHTANIEKAHRLLEWKPAITIEQGIEKAIKWYTDNQKWCEKQLWMRRIPILLREGEKTVH